MAGWTTTTRSTLLVTGIVAAFVLLLLLLGVAVDVFLLAFAGLLVAVFLRGLARWLHEMTSLPLGWALGVVTLSIVAVAAGTAWLLAPSIATQVTNFPAACPKRRVVCRRSSGVGSGRDRRWRMLRR